MLTSTIVSFIFSFKDQLFPFKTKAVAERRLNPQRCCLTYENALLIAI